MDALTQAVTQSFAAPPTVPPPVPPLQQGLPCLLIDVMRDYNEAFQMLQNATDESQRAFINRCLARFNAELDATIPGNNGNGDSEPGNNDGNDE